MCPANLTVYSPDGNASPVVYEAPSLIAGEPPIKTTCTPSSGEVFVLGSSTIMCTATDAVLRTNDGQRLAVRPAARNPDVVQPFERERLCKIDFDDHFVGEDREAGRIADRGGQRWPRKFRQADKWNCRGLSQR